MILELRIQPRARRNALVATPDGRWKLQLTAPPLEGRANDALIDFFAKGLGIARARIQLVSGEKSRHKIVALEGVDESQIRRLAAGK